MRPLSVLSRLVGNRRNLARSPNSHGRGRAYGAPQRAGDVPGRMVSHNHLAIGAPRRAVAREDRTDVGFFIVVSIKTKHRLPFAQITLTVLRSFQTL